MPKHPNIKLIITILIPFFAYLLAHVLITYNDKPICLWKNIFHTNCFGCGITRAFYAFCHLDFSSAFNYNKMIFVIIPILLYLWIKEILKNL